MPALLQHRRHCALATDDRFKPLRKRVIILPTLLKLLSVSADEDGIVRRSTAMYDNRGKPKAPTSFHQAIGLV